MNTAIILYAVLPALVILLVASWVSTYARWNIPILSFLARTWMLLVFVVVANMACQNEALFQKWGALIYIPAVTSTVWFVNLLCVHLFFRQTVDQDAHDGTYVKDWVALTPHQRVAWATVIRIGSLIALSILCAGLARG